MKKSIEQIAKDLKRKEALNAVRNPNPPKCGAWNRPKI